MAFPGGAAMRDAEFEMPGAGWTWRGDDGGFLDQGPFRRKQHSLVLENAPGGFGRRLVDVRLRSTAQGDGEMVDFEGTVQQM